MAIKTDDISVATGKYIDKDGNEKTRWKNVGSVMESGEGNVFILMDRTFNPAGVPMSRDADGNLENRSSVLLSIFPVKNDNTNQ